MTTRKSHRRTPTARGQRESGIAPGAVPTRPSASAIWALLPVLLIVTAAVYQRAWHGGVLWDDDAHLTSAALRADGGLGRIWFQVGATQQYYPLVHSAFWLMDRLWGGNTLGYHLVTIALHACSAWLLALVLRRLAIPGAWLAAVIFALHPVQVESVAWMTELKNTLSGVLYFAAALAYLAFDERRAWRPYAIALVLFVFALLSKTVTATLPAGLLVVFWWQRGQVDWRRDVRPLVPFFALGVASGLMTAWVERTFIMATGSDFALTAIERCLVAGRALWFYLGKLVWPMDLSFVYTRWTVSASVWWQYLFPVAAIALTVALWRLRRRSRAPLAAWLFFAGTLVPALGFVNVYPFRYSFVADHFQYLASADIIALAAAAIVTHLHRMRWPAPRAEAVACAVLALPLAALTWRQAGQYVDADTLYRATLARNPTCWMAYNNLAALALARTPPDLEAALANVQASLRINAANEVAHNNLGVLLQRQGRFDEAAREHAEAVRLKPNYADAISNRGVDVAALGRYDEAVAHYTEALRLKPAVAGVHQNMALALQSLGRLDDAIAHIREALRLDPDYADAHDNLGTALQRQGHLTEAIAEYREAVRLAPASAGTFNNLGAALFSADRLDEAAAAFETAVRLQPGAGLAHDNLGRVRLKQNRRDEALVHFREAVRLEPRYGPAHLHLGETLHAAGRLPEAAVEYQAALALDPDSAETHNNLGVVLANLGRVGEAAPHFAEAVRLKPDFAEARANLLKTRGGRAPGQVRSAIFDG